MKLGWLVVAACGNTPAPDAAPSIPTLVARWTFVDTQSHPATCSTLAATPVTKVKLSLTSIAGDPALVPDLVGEACPGTLSMPIGRVAKYAIEAVATDDTGFIWGAGSGNAVDFTFPNSGSITSNITIRANPP